MSEHPQAQVLVVGAGPVGLTQAIDLAERDVRVLVAETRLSANRRTSSATTWRPARWRFLD